MEGNVIRHIVLFNFLPTATREQTEAVIAMARDQLSRIPGVRNLAVSTSFEVVQPPAYRYALTMEFADEDALRGYIDHPVHQEFRKVFFPVRESSLVVDLREMEGSAWV